jgi:hypothetical protein
MDRQPDRPCLGLLRHVADSPGGARAPSGICTALPPVRSRGDPRGQASGPAPLGSR